MATQKSTNVADFILDDFKTGQILVKKKHLVRFLVGEYNLSRFQKARKAAKAILKDRRRETGFYDAPSEMAEYLDNCFSGAENQNIVMTGDAYKLGPVSPTPVDRNLKV